MKFVFFVCCKDIDRLIHVPTLIRYGFVSLDEFVLFILLVWYSEMGCPCLMTATLMYFNVRFQCFVGRWRNRKSQCLQHVDANMVRTWFLISMWAETIIYTHKQWFASINLNHLQQKWQGCMKQSRQIDRMWKPVFSLSFFSGISRLFPVIKS